MTFGVFAGYRQVFGLTGVDLNLLADASQPAYASQCSIRRSFLLTAAGQFRILTGFPLRASSSGHR